MVETVFCIHATLHAIIARLRVADIRAIGGPLYPQLIFPFQCEMVPQNDIHELWILAVRANLTIPSLGKIGVASPTNMPYRLLKKFASNGFPITIEVPLDLYRAQKLEESRQGNVEFRLDCWLEYLSVLETDEKKRTHLNDSPELYTMHQQINITVSQSEWIKNVLPGLGGNIVKLIEIEVPDLAAYPGFEKSLLALEKAQQHFKLGFYDEAAGQCRIALEPFFEQVDKADGTGKMPVLKKSWETTLGKATYTWLSESLNAIKWATNPVHHSPTARFDRFEAQMLLMITTNLISHATRMLDPKK